MSFLFNPLNKETEDILELEYGSQSLEMVNINTYNNEEMVLIKFCGNIFFWIFSVVDHKSVTDAGIIDSILAKPSLSKSNFCIRALSKHVF